MKKLALAAAVAFIALAAYRYSQQQAELMLNDSALDYVPADTLIFSGQLKPFPLKQYLLATAVKAAEPAGSNPLGDHGAGPAARFASFLYGAYQAGVDKPQELLGRFGLADDIRSYFYTLGAVPVLRFEIADAAAFWHLIDEAEQDSGWQHRQGELASQPYRAYPIVGPQGNTPLELLLSERDGMVSISLIGPFVTSAQLANALGVTKVDNPLSVSRTLAQIIDSQGYTGDSVSYIDHRQLARALTSVEDPLGKQLSAILAGFGLDPLGALRTPDCERELGAIAANWPRTLAGIRRMTVSSTHANIETKLLIESHNQVLLKALQRLRGFLPGYVHNPVDSVFVMGLGVEVGALAGSFNEIWNELIATQWQCRPLARLQHALGKIDPAMVGMATAMADGVKGLGGAVLDYRLDMINDEPLLKSLDAVLSLSAKDPAFLFRMVRPFVAALGKIDLKAGEDLDVSELLPGDYGLSVRLGLRGQHLVLYSGEGGKRLADALALEPLAVNGVFGAAVDYGRLLEPLAPLLQAQGERLPQPLLKVAAPRMKLQLSVDVSDAGPALRAVLATQAMK